MKKIVLLTIMLTLITATFVGAQNFGEIRGKVYESGSSVTIPGAGISVLVGSSLLSTATDVNGNFVLKPLPAGVYTIRVSFTGKVSNIIEDVVVNPGKITKIDNQYLAEATIDLSDTIATITAFRDPLVKIDPIITIRPDVISDLAGKNKIENIIKIMSSDIYVTENDEIYFRGSRNTDFAYIVDGVKQMDGKAKVPSGSIGSISVYTGGVPAQYGDFTGGCVVIETMGYFDWVNMNRK